MSRYSRAIAGMAAAGSVIGMAAVYAPAWPPYLDAWQVKYPTSTIPQRMQAITGTQCNTCHMPPSRSSPGTCYREDLAYLLWIQQLPLGQALDVLDGWDSDGDGVANGTEITMPRHDQPGQVGYHPGLIWSVGMPPCAENPLTIVTGQSETPPGACYANCDGSTTTPVLNVADFTCFLQRFAAGHPYANCDGSSTPPILNVADFTCFLQRFAAGCP